jgi:protein-L-isoaspartate O-methyltransferase
MSYQYVGSELEVFSTATNWKAYLAILLRPLVAGRVLEVGAGIGSNVPYLHNALVREWTCLEPDESLARRIEERLATHQLPANCHAVTGTIASIDGDALFDAILYLDVLEHIAEDWAELEKAAAHLSEGGFLIVLAPAHQFLFSAFDREIGHHRRYSAAGLRALAPPGCSLVFSRMLDSAGFFASLGNLLLLQSAAPSPAQIAFWDKILVPVSRRFDRRLGYRFGKSVLALWKKTSPAAARRGA